MKLVINVSRVCVCVCVCVCLCVCVCATGAVVCLQEARGKAEGTQKEGGKGERAANILR